MAIPNSDRSAAARLGLVTALCGLAAAAWIALLLQGIWSAGLVENAASRIVSGDRFKRDAPDGVVEDLARAPQQVCWSPSRAEAVRQLNLAERAFATEAEAELGLAAAAAIDVAPVRRPSMPIGGAARFALATSRLGADPTLLPELVGSYQLGPREGWIALLRHPRALAVFAQLDPATQQRVVEEFAGLVSAQLTRDAVLALGGLGWPIRGSAARRPCGGRSGAEAGAAESDAPRGRGDRGAGRAGRG